MAQHAATYQLSERIRRSSMLCKEGIVFILVRVLLTAHEQHVLQVVAQALHMSLCL